MELMEAYNITKEELKKLEEIWHSNRESESTREIQKAINRVAEAFTLVLVDNPDEVLLVINRDTINSIYGGALFGGGYTHDELFRINHLIVQLNEHNRQVHNSKEKALKA